MSKLYPTATAVAEFQEGLDDLKSRMIPMCKEMNYRKYFSIPNSVERYNEVRDMLKGQYDSQVIFMLDGSGFINEVTTPSEREWTKRKFSK